VSLNDVYEVTIRQRAYNQTILNVFHYRESTNTPGLHMLELATVIDANMAPVFASNLHLDWSYDATDVALVAPGIRTDVTTVNTNAQGGALPGLLLPINACATITKKTGLAGPRFRGRSFISGLTMDDVDDGQLDLSGIANMQDIADEIELPQVSGAIQWLPVLFGPGHVGPTNTTIIAEAVVRPILRNQRRRQVGRGI